LHAENCNKNNFKTEIMTVLTWCCWCSWWHRCRNIFYDFFI